MEAPDIAVVVVVDATVVSEVVLSVQFGPPFDLVVAWLHSRWRAGKKREGGMEYCPSDDDEQSHFVVDWCPGPAKVMEKRDCCDERRRAELAAAGYAATAPLRQPRL